MYCYFKKSSNFASNLINNYMNQILYTLAIICICGFYNPLLAQFQQALPLTLTGGTPDKINTLKNSPLIKNYAIDEQHNVVTFVPADGVSMEEFHTFWNSTLSIREIAPPTSTPINMAPVL